jgi:hypothetical protein
MGHLQYIHWQHYLWGKLEQVMHLGAAREPGPFADNGGGGLSVAEVNEALDGGVEQALSRLGAAFLLGPSASRASRRRRLGRFGAAVR